MQSSFKPYALCLSLPLLSLSLCLSLSLTLSTVPPQHGEPSISPTVIGCVVCTYPSYYGLMSYFICRALHRCTLHFLSHRRPSASPPGGRQLHRLRPPAPPLPPDSSPKRAPRPVLTEHDPEIQQQQTGRAPCPTVSMVTVSLRDRLHGDRLPKGPSPW